jgi:cell division transport system permease protein
MNMLYVLKETASGFRRAKIAASGSVITIALSLLLLGVFYVVSTNTSRIVESIRAKVEMEVFLDEPVTEQRVEEIRDQLLSVPGVEGVQFISKEEAAAIFKKEFGEDINAVLAYNPLPPSFKVYLTESYQTSDKAGTVEKAVGAVKGVDHVIYRREMLQFIEKQARTLYFIGLGLGLLIGISAIFLVSNTIRLTIYAKRKSVQTMKLVGASRWMVRAPFLFEGFVQGLLGGLIASGVLYYLLTFATALVSPELSDFLRIEPAIYGAVVAAGVALGFFGSAVSVKRFIGETVAS